MHLQPRPMDPDIEKYRRWVYRGEGQPDDRLEALSYKIARLIAFPDGSAPPHPDMVQMHRRQARELIIEYFTYHAPGSFADFIGFLKQTAHAAYEQSKRSDSTTNWDIAENSGAALICSFSPVWANPEETL